MQIALADLQEHLAEFLHRAEAGDEAAVIARIRALPFVLAGSGGKPEGSSTPVRIGLGEKNLAETVFEDRE